MTGTAVVSVVGLVVLAVGLTALAGTGFRRYRRGRAIERFDFDRVTGPEYAADASRYDGPPPVWPPQPRPMPDTPTEFSSDEDYWSYVGGRTAVM